MRVQPNLVLGSHLGFGIAATCKALRNSYYQAHGSWKLVPEHYTKPMRKDVRMRCRDATNSISSNITYGGEVLHIVRDSSES